MPAMNRHSVQSKVTAIFLPLAKGDTPLTIQGQKGVRGGSGMKSKTLHPEPSA